ncbi:MAG: zf-HC2 domain-containing protein [Deltaproteobacteria bacterium]|nr:zf-HC2 domain-containing protein [Deltaproteobacteria bacterium]
MTENAECRQCQDWIDDAFSGELAAELRPKLQAHLDSCPECRAVWQDTQTLQRGMALLAESDGPSLKSQTAILRAAEARAEKGQAKRAGLWSWLFRPATVAFATLALVAGLSILGRQELQKKKAAEQQVTSPVLAPQGTTTIEAAPMGGMTAPATLPQTSGNREGTAKAKKSEVDTKTAPKPQQAEQAPVKTDEERRKIPVDQAIEAAPSTLGVLKDSDTARPAPAPMKALAKPVPPPPPASDPLAPASVQAPSIPEAEKGAGGSPQKEAPNLQQQEKKQENFQPPGGDALGAVNSVSGGKSLERAATEDKAKEPTDRFQSLLNSAKLKIRQQKYPAALEDLLAAQRIRDNKEIQDLILLCRSHLRGDG